ncbi:hypothetical protein OOK44_36410 [Streptomyces cellulosae]|uniref:hypothetical protein n=1 Tax=Streptomyces cellulosae TaxID=1968 RepID=UPI002259345A|nr:hypothetical protein [Streptomyces cellulosae]WTC60879.1 hypothetical protein OH715_36910 [Streptomyces cellulosae]
MTAALSRASTLHLGVLHDVFALRGAEDPDVCDSAHTCGDTLRYLDDAATTTTGVDYLRQQYARAHNLNPATDDQFSPLLGQSFPEPLDLDVFYPATSDLIHHMCDAYFWSKIRNPALPPDAAATEARRHLICHGLLLDYAAALTPADTAAAAAAAEAGHALRARDGRPTCSDHNARAYLLDAYRDLKPSEELDAHPVDCPGGCRGDGIVLETVTWESQGDGIYVPVYQEPVDCSGGEPDVHSENCPTCKGHGYTYSRGERHLCFG